MHQVAVANLLLHHHGNQQFQDLLKRLDQDVLLGSCVLSDPATGGFSGEGGGRGGGVLPSDDHTGMCSPFGYGFQTDFVWNGVYVLLVWKRDKNFMPGLRVINFIS